MKSRGGTPPVAPDPYPDLPIEKGPRNKGVGSWVPADKHRLLCEYLDGTRHAWKKWSKRYFLDPFAGPGRIQVAGETFTREGGALRAWRTLSEIAPFSQMLIGDIDPGRVQACTRRLTAIGASAQGFPGAATNTIKSMVRAIPPRSLCLAYIDPYNLEFLDYSIFQELAKLEHVDLAVNFCTMDLQRNADLEFDPERARFDGTAPGWREQPDIRAASRKNLKLLFFNYWCGLIRDLGFSHSREMPLIRNDQGNAIYRMVFFARHNLPTRIWGDVARGRNQTQDLFDDQ